MVPLFPFVLLGLIVVVVWAVTRTAKGGDGAAAPRPGGSRPGVARRDAVTAVEDWVAAGLVSREQGAAILDHEAEIARVAALPPPPSAGGAARGSRIPAFAEALGYLGAALATAGVVLVAVRAWSDLGVAGRLASSGIAAAALLVGGLLVTEDRDPALARLRWVLWTASTAAFGLFAGVFAADVVGSGYATTLVLTSATAVALESGVLWWGRARPLQQLGFLAGSLLALGALIAEWAELGVTGLVVWAASAAVLAAGLTRRTTIPALTEGVGAVGVIAAGLVASGQWDAVGLLLAAASSSGLLVLAAAPAVPTLRADRAVLTTVGALGLLQTGPATIGYFADGAAGVTGLVVWSLGGLLLVTGLAGRTRTPTLTQAAGALALVGGAALTGAQWTGFATLAGIATALVLVALGASRGSLLPSIAGSLGLLINVPWAIGWFFPGEGRVPLLVVAAGLVILTVAVVLGRRWEHVGPTPPGTPDDARRQGPTPPTPPAPPTQGDSPMVGRGEAHHAHPAGPAGG